MADSIVTHKRMKTKIERSIEFLCVCDYISSSAALLASENCEDPDRLICLETLPTLVDDLRCEIVEVACVQHCSCVEKEEDAKNTSTGANMQMTRRQSRHLPMQLLAEQPNFYHLLSMTSLDSFSPKDRDFFDST